MKNFWNRAFTLVGRTGVALFALILFIHGSTKNSTNVNNDAEREVLGDVMSVADEFELSERLLAADEGVASTADLEEITVECVPDDTATNEDSGATVSAAEIAQGWRVVSVATNDVVSYEMPMNAIEYRPWAVRGGFQDRFWLDFGDWTFPLGLNEYSRVAVSTWGEILTEWNDEAKKIAAVGMPMAAVPGVSTFWWAEGENDSRILTWKDFALNRDTNTLVSAQMVLKANGDFTLYSNNVVRTCTRIEAFDWDGDGIANVDDANPMRWDGNYFGQTEEQKEFVALSVGSGLENGYYRFRATFPSAPTRRTLLTVGTNHVVVTEAGDYDFLLEKGIEYTFGTEPVNMNVIYTAVDDVPREDENGLMMVANNAWTSSGWSIDGGELVLNVERNFSRGTVFWLPLFSGSPDIVHVGPDELSFTCAANFMDGREPANVSYQWRSKDGNLVIESPRAKETNVRISAMPNWEEAELSVTARFGTNSLTASITFSYGKNSEPETRLFISVPSLLIRKDLWMDGSRAAKLLVDFHSDRAMSGVLTLRQKSGEELVALSKGFSGQHTLYKDKSYYEVFDVSGIKESSQENDVCFECVFTPSDSSEEEITAEAKCTVLAPVRVEVPSAPTTGLAVLKGTDVAAKLIFAPSNTTLAPVVEWRTAKRKTRTQYDDWFLREEGRTRESTLTMNEAGVFALCARMICGSQSNEVEYVHLTDDRWSECYEGDRDHIGVAETESMLTLRRAVIAQLGNKEYGLKVSLPERNGFSKVDSGGWKCNAFVADVAISCGCTVPQQHKILSFDGFHYYPPLANEWAKGNVSIEGWRHLGKDVYPVPGMIVGHPSTRRNEAGHCGIVDYDGIGVAAGTIYVSRMFEAFLDGTSGYNVYIGDSKNDE